MKFQRAVELLRHQAAFKLHSARVELPRLPGETGAERAYKQQDIELCESVAAEFREAADFLEAAQ